MKGRSDSLLLVEDNHQKRNVEDCKLERNILKDVRLGQASAALDSCIHVGNTRRGERKKKEIKNNWIEEKVLRVTSLFFLQKIISVVYTSSFKFSAKKIRHA